MQQLTSKQLMTMPANERNEALKQPFELGVKSPGRNCEFIAKGVYVPSKLDDEMAKELSRNEAIKDLLKRLESL